MSHSKVQVREVYGLLYCLCRCHKYRGDSEICFQFVHVCLGHILKAMPSKSMTATCADPESFARGGPTLTTFFLVDEGREDQYHYKRAIIGR